MDRIRICFFADGKSVHTLRWLREMAQLGFDVVLVTRRPDEGGEFATRVIAPGLDGAGWLRGLAAVRRVVGELRPDIVHGHYITSYGLWAAVSGARPLVLTAWGSDILVTPGRSRLARWTTGWTLRRADLITADSADTLAAIRGYGPRARLKQVQWGVDLGRMPRAEAGADGGVLNVVSLRSWAPNYNIDLILHAFAGLVAAQPERACHLHLLGGGQLEPSLRTLARALDIVPMVSFHGLVDEPRLHEILGRAHVSVSVPTSDATAMSLLESMAAGLPVVVSDLKANRQWVDESGGRIVPVGDAAATGRALIELARDARLRGKMGARNRAEVEARASRRIEMDRMAGLYQSLLAERV